MTPEAMAALHAACFPDRPWSTSEIAALLDRPGTCCVIDPEGYAMALAQVILDEAEILTIAVAPKERRGGRGARLLARLQAEAAAAGATRLFLEVAADNTPARALYARAGYAETGRRAEYYRRADGTRIDALILSRPLP
jgi:Acetyltransferases